MPPKAKKVPKELSIHGHTRVDDYFWLNERENKEVLDYLRAENEYTQAIMAPLKNFQKTLFDEMVARIKKDDSSVPYFTNGYFYYSRYEEGKEYPIHCRKKESLDAPEQLLVDVNELAKGHEYFSLGGLAVSDDNKLMSYGVDTVSRRLYTIYVKNIETGEVYKDELPNTTASVAWAADNKTFFYTVQDLQTLRSARIMRHVLGTSVVEDVEVFFEKDETYSTFVYRSKSEKYIIIGSYSTLSEEYRTLKASDPMGEFNIFHKREEELEYSISHFNDKFYVLTNLDAKNFRLMETPEDKTDKQYWKDVVPHREDVMIDDMEIFQDHLVLEERSKGLLQIRVMNTKTGDDHYLDFGEAAYEAYTGTNPEFGTNILRFEYSSMTTPYSTFDYNMDAKSKELKKQQEVLGDFKAENYETERIYVKARDGIEVPVSIVYRKGMKKDGSNPLLLYAYGSYGASMDAYFSSVRLSLLDRNVIYAIAHIRGGEEMGRSWYEDGKLLKKQNTFTDFVDCAKQLIEDKYTNPNNLFAMGGSAGGLLMGAVVNMNPELFKGVVASVPFVDVVTTMLDETIPLTTSEFDEWGDPKEKEYYDYILAYSPYDNVKAMAYPAMLVTTGLHDSQVQYWEPAKWVAKLRAVKTDNNLLLLHTNMDVGHGGASGRFERYKETAMEFAFILNLAGITK